jgi:hypothetical protein
MKTEQEIRERLATIKDNGAKNRYMGVYDLGMADALEWVLK